MNGKRTTLLFGTVLAGLAILALTAGDAQAGPRHRLPHPRPGIVIGGFFAPRPAVERTWVPGHYETRTERVLVEPAHYETRRVREVTETRYDYYGKPYTVLVRPARVERVWVPARYETRCVRVWVPGHYVETRVATPPLPRWHIGVRF